MDSRHDFTLEKVFWGYFGALDQKANSALQTKALGGSSSPHTYRAPVKEPCLVNTAMLHSSWSLVLKFSHPRPMINPKPVPSHLTALPLVVR